MKKRTIILTTLMLVLTISITAQKLGRRMMVNYGGEVIATYNLPQNIDSLTFETYKLYNVTVSSSDATMGSVTTSATEVGESSNVTLTATPNDGYEFVNWTVNGEVVSTKNPYTATVTANTEYVANFVETFLVFGNSSDPLSADIITGETTTLVVIPLYTYLLAGESLLEPSLVTYSIESLNGAEATVKQAGIDETTGEEITPEVSITHAGTIIVTATSKDKSATLEITAKLKIVQNLEGDKLQLQTTKNEYVPGETDKIKTTLFSIYKVNDDEYTWVSSNPGVVSVDNEGNITALSDGTATITVSITDEFGYTATASKNLTVRTPNPNADFNESQWNDYYVIDLGEGGVYYIDTYEGSTELFSLYLDTDLSGDGVYNVGADFTGTIQFPTNDTFEIVGGTITISGSQWKFNLQVENEYASGNVTGTKNYLYLSEDGEWTSDLCTVSAISSNVIMGTVEPYPSIVNKNGTVVLTATPAEGYEFANWTVNGDVISTENPYTASITASKEFVANFETPLSEPTGTENGYGYVDLGLPSGIKWATYNVGATTPEEYGYYFAWGETESKEIYDWSTYKYCNGTETSLTKYCTNSDYGTVDNKTVLELEDDAARINWGGNWRIPTNEEIDELRDTNNCTWSWTTQNGVDGYKVTSKVNGNSIFLPAAGLRHNGYPSAEGGNGVYCSSSLVTYNVRSYFANYLWFSSSYVERSGSERCMGGSVRAVYALPTYTITVSSSNETMGSVTASATEVGESSNVTLTATPNEGYFFVNWTVNGEVVSTDNPYTATITEDVVFVANFEVNPIKDPINSLSHDELVYVEGGTFTMGATSEQESDADDDEEPAHKVTLSSYYIGKYEVTQQLWEYVMSYSGKAADGTTMTAYSSDVWLGTNPSSSPGIGNNYPAYYVSYDDIVNIFLPRLNKITGNNYRLPTEAEWEYAARGGKNSKRYRYSGSHSISSVACYSGNSGSKVYGVGIRQANELGIYDMSGNVWEWCSDLYGSYSSSAQTNPTGPTSGSGRVKRGGCFSLNEWECRVSNRGNDNPVNRSISIGFRLASDL